MNFKILSHELIEVELALLEYWKTRILHCKTDPQGVGLLREHNFYLDKLRLHSVCSKSSEDVIRNGMFLDFNLSLLFVGFWTLWCK